MSWLITLAVVILLYLILERKTSRPDGHLVTRLHPYRRIMPFIMRGRNESVVYYDIFVPADNLVSYLKRVQERFHADVTHVLVAGLSVTLTQNPKMNRFVVGRRLYERDGIDMTFSMKRKKLDKTSKIGVVKLRIDQSETFQGFCERVNSRISVERTDTKTYVDRELSILEILPRPILNLGVYLLKTLDYYNLLPRSFIEGDGMYTSAFIANLGSLGMPAGYHHLYEWGTSSLFIVGGKIDDQPVVENGQVMVQNTLHLRVAYDERMDDGLTARQGIETYKTVLSDPERFFGCLEDGETPLPFKPLERSLESR